MEEFKITSKDVVAIGAGAPGVINIEKGIVLFSPNLPWKNYESKYYNLNSPVLCQN